MMWLHTRVQVCCLLVTLIAAPGPVFAQFGLPFDASRQQQINDLVNRGRAAFDAGKMDDALALFQEVLRQEPNHVEANFRIGSIFWARRDVQRALQFMQHSVELAPNNASLRLSVGGYFEQVNLLDQAIANYQAALPLLEGTPEHRAADKRLNLALAKRYAAQGDMDTSLQLLNALVDEYPDDTRVMQHLGFALLLANRLRDAAQIYEEVLAREPNNDTAHMNIAGVYEKMEDYPNATAHFRRVIELNVDRDRVTEANVRLALLTAAQFQKQGSLELATQELQRALATAPNHPLVNLQLASLYQQRQRFDDAEAALIKVVDAFPDNLDARLRLGKLYLERSNFVDAVWELDLVVARGGRTPFADEANAKLQQLRSTYGDQLNSMRELARNKNLFKQRLAVNPNDTEAHFNLGIIYVNQQLWDKARVEFEAARQLDPTIARVYANLIQVYTQLSLPKEAGEAMLTYISLENDVDMVEKSASYVATVLGQMLFIEKQPDAALFQFRRVLESVPDDALANYYVGVILAGKGQLGEAAVAYEKVLEKLPTHLGARGNLALVYEQLRMDEEALTQYRRIALAAPPGQMKTAAEQRAVVLQRSINGITSSAAYSLNYDSNSNLSDANPAEEYSSSLSGNFVYRYKYSNPMRMGMSIAPTYTTYHVGQYDYLTVVYEPFASYTLPGESYSFRYNYQDVSGVLNNQNVSVTKGVNFDYNRDLRPGYSLTPSLAYRRFESQSSSRFNSNTYTLRVDYGRAMARGLSDSMSGIFSYNDNLKQIESTNPFESNEDSVYQSYGVSYQITKWLSSQIYVTGSAAYTYTDYLNPDRFGCERRQNQNITAALSMNYRFNDNIRVYASTSLVDNNSNLPVFVYDSTLEGVSRTCDGESIRGGFRPLRSEELVGVPVQSAALGDYRKFLLNVGLSVNF